MRYFCSLAAIIVSALLLASTTNAQSYGSDVFVLETGIDTLAVERFTTSPGLLEGEIVGNLFGRTIYEMRHHDGHVYELTLQSWAPGNHGATPTQTAFVRMEGDSAFVQVSSASGILDQAFATTPGAIPYLNPSVAQLEFIKDRAEGLTTFDTQLLLLQGGMTLTARVARQSADSVSFTIAGADLLLILDDEGVARRGEIPSQNVRITRDASAPFPADALTAPDYSAPDDAPYSAESVIVETRTGHVLAGTLTIPRHADRHPAVVMITGSGPQDRDQAIPSIRGYRPFRDIADALSRRGIAVLRMDDRGFGASTGSFGGSTSADFADDIRDAVAYLRTRADIDPGRIALVGHSEGGLIAPMVAASDESLAGIVIIAGPAQTGRRIIDFQIDSAVRAAAGANTSPAAIDSLIQEQHRSIDSMAEHDAWIRYFLAYDPLPTARSVTSIPVLIAHGETDIQVTIEQARDLADAFEEGGNTNVTVVTFPDVNHLLLRDPDGHPARYTTLIDRAVVPELLDAVGNWLEGILVGY